VSATYWPEVSPFVQADVPPPDDPVPEFIAATMFDALAVMRPPLIVTGGADVCTCPSNVGGTGAGGEPDTTQFVTEFSPVETDGLAVRGSHTVLPSGTELVAVNDGAYDRYDPAGYPVNVAVPPGAIGGAENIICPFGPMTETDKLAVPLFVRLYAVFTAFGTQNGATGTDDPAVRGQSGRG